MRLPDYLDEENRIEKKYLYPIMYDDKENNIKLIYSNELNELKKNLEPSIVEILLKVIDRRKIAIIDSTLTKEEQVEFIRKFVQQTPTNVNSEDIKDEVKSFSKDNFINISLTDIINYLSSEVKQKVNMAMELEMPYIIEKLYINDDITMIMVVLDTIMNNKTNILSSIIINNNVRNSCIMGTSLKDIAAYYKSDILGPTNNVTELDASIEKLEEIIISLSTVSNAELTDYTVDAITDVLNQQEGNRKK